jgi:HEAT repeat protein
VTERSESLAAIERDVASVDEEVRRGAVLRMRGLPVGEILPVVEMVMGDTSWRVRKEAVDLFSCVDSGPPIVEEIVRMLRSDENAGLRNSAVEALMRIGQKALPVLHRYASDPDQDVRKFILDIIGGIADPASVPFLAEALHDGDVNVRAAAAENLGRIGTAETIPHLIAALSHPDLWLRFSVLEALASAERPVPSAAILPLAAEDLLRKAVFDCLGSVGDIDGASLLLEGLRENSRKTREGAVRALARLRGRVAAEERECIDVELRALRGTNAVEGMLSLLERTDLTTEEAVMALLGVIADERSVGTLLHGCRDERLRPYCINAFKEIAASAPESLLAAFDDGTYEERSLIVYLCGELRFPGVDHFLSRALADSSPAVRSAAAIASGKSGIGSLVEKLLPLLDDQESEVRDAVVEALARLARLEPVAIYDVASSLAGADSAARRVIAAVLFAAVGDGEKLSLLAKDEAASVRRGAVAGLARLKLRASVAHLTMALVDEDPDVRSTAAGALGEIGGEEVIPPLTLALRDDDPWLQCAALRGLGRQGSAALASVSAAAEEATGMVRIAALEALADIGGEEAGSLISSALDDSDEDVVRTAIDLLEGGGYTGWIDEHALKLLSHPHWEVRGAIVKALAGSGSRGQEAVPIILHALEVEGDELVRAQMQEAVDRFR